MISEKTLELNFTYEILAIAYRFSTLVHARLSTASTGSLASPLLPIPAHLQLPYALGLSLREEKHKGWDVKIEFPRSPSKPSYALFLQFKAGTHFAYSTNTSSVFLGGRLCKKPHCRFEINNNSTCDQHIVLQALSLRPGLLGAVTYAFPRVPNAKTFKACVGRLLHVTSIIRVSDIDLSARRAGICITKGVAHEFRTSYTAPFYREICSEPKLINVCDTIEWTLFAEIVALQVKRYIESWRSILLNTPLSLQTKNFEWLRVFKTFEIELARYLAVSPDFYQKLTQQDLTSQEREMLQASVTEFGSFRAALRDDLSIRNDDVNNHEFLPQSVREEAMKLVCNKLTTFRNYLAGDWFEKSVPNIAIEYMIPVSDELSVDLSSLSEELSASEFSNALRRVSYQGF